MSHIDTDIDIIRYVNLIGKKVCKAQKPFKSGNKENTVKGVVINSNVNRLAFIFEEDDSNVECWRCLEVKMTNREMFEESFKRPTNYHKLSPDEQWDIDERLGILDLDGNMLSALDIERYHKHYEK
jgi:hypothetical protein